MCPEDTRQVALKAIRICVFRVFLSCLKSDTRHVVQRRTILVLYQSVPSGCASSQESQNVRNVWNFGSPCYYQNTFVSRRLEPVVLSGFACFLRIKHDRSPTTSRNYKTLPINFSKALNLGLTLVGNPWNARYISRIFVVGWSGIDLSVLV